jgi:glycosyltransferase involved in cell wall biosynthesis
VIYNGVRLNNYMAPADRESMRDNLGIPADSIVLITVANLIPYKGHEDLLNALDSIKDGMPQNWCLLAVGRDDGIRHSLEKMCAVKGLDKNVKFLGSRTDIPALLRVSDIGILCSHQEGFSNAILEAMAAGLPMVVTDAGGNREAVEDGVTGLVVPIHEPLSLGKAILRLAKDQQLAKRMGKQAKLRAQERFSLETCVSRYDALYESLRMKSGIPESLK